MQEFIDTSLNVSHFAFDTIGSTNDEAFRLAEEKGLDCFFVTAKKQTGGRGRRGRQWVSEAGNLYCSVFLKKPAAPEKCSELSFITVVALGWALSDLLPEAQASFQYKWPNDLLWNGAKMAGLLLEARQHADGINIVVGLGVNCVSFPEGTPYPATSLKHEDIDLSADKLFESFKKAFLRAIMLWNKGKDFALFRNEWLKNAAGFGEEIVVRLHDEEVAGIFKEIDGEGRLILQLFDGTVRIINAGDVFFPSITG